MNTQPIQILSNALKMPTAKKSSPKGNPKTAAVKASKKATAVIPACPKGYILVGHGREGVVAENISKVSPVTPVEIVMAGKAFKSLAVNLLAGRIHPDILKAYEDDTQEKDKKKANRLTTLLGGRENRGHIGFLRALIPIERDDLTAAWNAYVVDHKEKETYPSLSGLIRACSHAKSHNPATGGKKRTSFTAALKEVLKSKSAKDVDQIPVWLFDLLVEYKMIEEEETKQ